MLSFNRIEPKKNINPLFFNESLTESELTESRELINEFILKRNQTKELKQDEEHHKGNLKDFLTHLFYNTSKYRVNNKSYRGNMGSDLVIYEKDSNTSKVIIEVKIPDSNEMISSKSFLKKSFYETILYYLWEREIEKNNDLKTIIITDLKDFYVFFPKDFYSSFYKDKTINKEFKNLIINKIKDNNGTEEFYKWCSINIDSFDYSLNYYHFNLDEVVKKDSTLIEFYKTLHPVNLIKETYINDSNSLNKDFYKELLYIIGLEENTIKNKKLITRMKKPIRGTIIESVILKIESENLLDNIENQEDYGDTYEDVLFNVSLELSITWINRVLFLKLLESKLISYNVFKDEQQYKFLNVKTIENYDELNSLFFNVLNEPIENRSVDIIEKFKYIPYLNSSLFETSDLEKKLIRISGLPDNDTIPVYQRTKVLDENGLKIKDKNLNTYKYLISFLNTYNFGVNGKDKVVKYKKELINSSVLGLIFEKINGYKEGSFYTPGFITNNMSKTILEEVVLDKFNTTYSLDCKTIEELYNKLNPSKEQEYIELFDSIKLCDPSVGSGHFLVSCLNQFLSIKSRLGIFLHRYKIYIDNDELFIKDRDGELIQYRVGKDGVPSDELQFIQESIFNEKKKIIEKSLFGVDLNPNSVKICRLRLWIELLKHSYYTKESKFTKLKTLPNIDINIKQGNSLIHRFKLDDEIKDILKTSNISLQDYLSKVNEYKETDNKKTKQEIQKQINSIKKNIVKELDSNLQRNLKKLDDEFKMLDMKLETIKLMGLEINDKELKEINSKKKKIQGITEQINHIIHTENFKNSFEWRFEFPELLDNEGKFIGFDIIIGNPPYIKEKDGKHIFEPVRKSGVWNHIIEGKMDYWFFFLHLGFDLLKENGRLTYITNSYWTKSSGSSKLINRIKNELTITELINFKDYTIFEEVVGNHMIHSYIKDVIPDYETSIKEITENFDEEEYIFEESKKVYKELITNDNNIQFEYDENSNIKFENTKLLFELYDVSTGVQESPDKLTKKMIEGVVNNEGFSFGDGVFVLSNEERNNLKFNKNEEDEFLKKYLYSQNVDRYKINYKNETLIFSDKFLHERLITENKFPNIKSHLDRFKDFITSDNKPYSLHRPRIKKIKVDNETIRLNIFEGEKLICKGMFDTPEFTYDNDKYYCGFSFSVIYKKEENYSLKYLLSILNSSFGKKWFHTFGKKRGIGVDIGVGVFQKFPVKDIPYKEQLKFEIIVDKIIQGKIENKDTTDFENKIDEMVNELYSK